MFDRSWCRTIFGTLEAKDEIDAIVGAQLTRSALERALADAILAYLAEQGVGPSEAYALLDRQRAHSPADLARFDETATRLAEFAVTADRAAFLDTLRLIAISTVIDGQLEPKKRQALLRHLSREDIARSLTFRNSRRQESVEKGLLVPGLYVLLSQDIGLAILLSFLKLVDADLAVDVIALFPMPHKEVVQASNAIDASFAAFVIESALRAVHANANDSDITSEMPHNSGAVAFTRELALRDRGGGDHVSARSFS